jgi:hypothetical protein
MALDCPPRGLRNFDWLSFRVPAYSIGSAALYFFMVLAFALYAAGITEGKITSEDADLKIRRKCGLAFLRARPYVFGTWGIYVAW